MIAVNLNVSFNIEQLCEEIKLERTDWREGLINERVDK
jgi:hypothetical protein